MSDGRVVSITLELDGASIVVRDPYGPAPRIAVVGTAAREAVEHALERAGIRAAPESRESVRSLRAPIPAPHTSEPIPPSLPSDALPAALSGLTVAVLRTGRSAPTTSVDEALGLVRRHSRARPLPCIERLLCRLEVALGDPAGLAETALALAAVGRAARRLASQDCEAAELGGDEIDELERPLADTLVVEVGRRRERGHAGFETRLLVDPTSGARLRECGEPERGELSLGPVGRKVFVSFGRPLASATPERVRILHYEYAPAADAADLARVLERARNTLAIPPALLEDPLGLASLPRAELLAPAGVALGKGGTITLSDTDGGTLAVNGRFAPGALDALTEIVELGIPVRALAGAFVVAEDGIGFEPWTALVGDDERLAVAQLAL